MTAKDGTQAPEKGPFSSLLTSGWAGAEKRFPVCWGRAKRIPLPAGRSLIAHPWTNHRAARNVIGKQPPGELFGLYAPVRGAGALDRCAKTGPPAPQPTSPTHRWIRASSSWFDAKQIRKKSLSGSIRFGALVSEVFRAYFAQGYGQHCVRTMAVTRGATFNLARCFEESGGKAIFAGRAGSRLDGHILKNGRLGDGSSRRGSYRFGTCRKWRSGGAVSACDESSCVGLCFLFFFGCPGAGCFPEA